MQVLSGSWEELSVQGGAGFDSREGKKAVKINLHSTIKSLF